MKWNEIETANMTKYKCSSVNSSTDGGQCSMSNNNCHPESIKWGEGRTLSGHVQQFWLSIDFSIMFFVIWLQDLKLCGEKKNINLKNILSYLLRGFEPLIFEFYSNLVIYFIEKRKFNFKELLADRSSFLWALHQSDLKRLD
jgi:hypothetical protein